MTTRLGGRYQLVRELGAGGMGRVYQALDIQTGKTVAAKVMLAGSEGDLEALLRFQQEGAVLATLKHPNIVEVYSTFLEQTSSCIVMELLQGSSLSQLLQSEPLSLPRAKGIVQQVAAALKYAHSRGIVHRDVKPDNIMVLAGDHVKVTDFGIARIMRANVNPYAATDTSMGTPLYMAPEQIEGQKADGRADIYSLGAVLYQMMTGRPPFDGSDPLTVAFKHVHKAPQPPSQLNASVPPDWEALILKALAKDPAARFQTAAALEEAVAALSGGEAAAPVLPEQPAAPSRGLDTVDRILHPEWTQPRSRPPSPAASTPWPRQVDRNGETIWPSPAESKQATELTSSVSANGARPGAEITDEIPNVPPREKPPEPAPVPAPTDQTEEEQPLWKRLPIRRR